MARREKKKKSGIYVFTALLLTVAIAAFVYKIVIVSGDHKLYENDNRNKTSLSSSLKIATNSYNVNGSPVPQPDVETENSVSTSMNKLISPNGILIRLKDHTVLMKKNVKEKIYPASLTKIMTTIVAIEELPNLKGEVSLTNSTFQGLYEVGASMAGFQPGEQVRAIDLLYGVILPSGAECCVGLADKIAGSEQNFVKIMNQKAADLGMENTHFENATGLQNESHYTTVEDLAILLSYALKNDTFRQIFTSSRHSTPPTNMHSDGITFNSTLYEKLNKNITGGKILGGKTGYTSAAGLCLASLAKVGNQEYILVTAGAKGDTNSEQFNISDAIAVYSSISK